MSADVTPFQRARLAAAEPLTAARFPTLPVVVTPELIAGLAQALAACTHDVPVAARQELECLLLNCRIVTFRASLS